MSLTVRRTVSALALAGILGIAARPAAALSLWTDRPATQAGHGSLEGAWTWLTHLWGQANDIVQPAKAPGHGPAPTTDEGPFIDPNGRS